MNLSTLLNSVAVHVVGLGFAGVAVYGYVSGHVDANGITAATALAGAYLGLQVASATAAPAPTTTTTPSTPTTAVTSQEPKSVTG